jgi:hypothetical protein
MIRSLIREMLITEMTSPTAIAAEQGMALFTIGDPKSHGKVIIYDPNLLLQQVRQARRFSRDADPKEVIVDSIDTEPIVRAGVTLWHDTDGQCNGSGIVGRAASVAGSRMGPAAYEAAMWLANGLTSDRKETSRAAGMVWAKYADRVSGGEIDALPFDDVSDPQTPPPEDDCELQDRDWLNSSYHLKSKPPGLDEMMSNHKKAASAVARFDLEESVLKWTLDQLFMMIFDERMSEDET